MDGKNYIQRAYESIIGNDYEQAIEWFEKAVDGDPLNASYHYSLSITYARSNKLNKAVEHAMEACKLEPSMTNYQLHLNTLKSKQLLIKTEQWIYKDNEHIGEALQLLKNAVELDPLSVEALLMLALAYAVQDRYNEAVMALKEARKLDPQHKEVLQLLYDYRILERKQQKK